MAQEAGDGGTRTRSVTAQHTRIGSPQGNPSLEAAFGREDPGGGFFQRCLAKSRGSTPEARWNWRDSIYEQIREVMLLQGSLSIERMCQLVPVSRRSFYRSLKEQQPAEEELEVRSAIQQIALEHRRRYGYRRITAELHRRGMQINHKRVVRISLPPPPPPPRAPSQPLGDPCRLAARRTLNAEARPASVHSRDSVCATASGRSQTHSFSYPPWGRRGWKSSGGSW